MSRHREIRNMDYTDDYDGYNDVYGHSIDDDYYISPSSRQFMYNRENSRDSTRNTEHEADIQEEDESGIESDVEKAKLESCIDELRATLGTIGISKNELIHLIRTHKYNVEKVLNILLERKEKVFTQQQQQQQQQTNESEPVSVKVVSTTTAKITKGFELPQKELLSTTPRSLSPASSGRQTPIVVVVGTTQPLEQNEERASISNNRGRDNVNKVDVNVEYKKERGSGKEHLYMVVIGHVDAGKSTLMGHFLCEIGQVNQKTMHKYEQESRKLGKQSFMYAWVLDETGEERNRGITMDVARFQFETKTKAVTLLDAPGHKDFIPNMISGAGQADVALLVVDATRGEFETGFDYGGQTREHALLVRSLGVTQLAVVVNKLDTVNWSKERFDDIVQKLKVFLKQAGFKENDVTFVPCSGLTGQNLITKPTENELLAWYNGPCLLDVIDNFRSPERPITKPFRLSINDIFKGTGSTFCVCGKVETGVLNVNDKVLVCPNRESATVKSLSIDEQPQTIVFAGDQATVTLLGIEMQNVSVGNILCDQQYPIPVTTRFEARIVVFNVTVPITKGFSVVLHHQSLVEPAVVSKLISQLNKSTGEIFKKHPRFLGNNTSAIVELQVTRPIAVELYSDCKELGRIMLRVGGVTIAAGLIIKIHL